MSMAADTSDSLNVMSGESDQEAVISDKDEAFLAGIPKSHLKLKEVVFPDGETAEDVLTKYDSKILRSNDIK